jgi:hypothetical protein
MATAQQIRDLITETTTGTLRPRVPREVRDEVCRYAIRRREKGTPWAVIARETGLDVLTMVAPNGVPVEGLALEQAAERLRLIT